MKNLFLIISFVFLFSSCANLNYYQVYHVTSESTINTKNAIIYEDSNCKITYNFWKEAGDIGFILFNKTNSDMTIDLAKSFFVINGMSNEYYQNRMFSKSKSSNVNTTELYYNHFYSNPTKINSGNSYGSSTTYIEKPQVTIPPNSSIEVSEFNIVSKTYELCDFVKYPKKNKVKSISFGKNDSPFVFYNLISYSVNGENLRIKNEFYIDKISNYPEGTILTQKDTSNCGKPLYSPVKIINCKSADQFYLRYKLSY